MKHKYDVSEWMRIGKERGYYDYFRDLIVCQMQDELLAKIPLNMKRSRKVIIDYFK